MLEKVKLALRITTSAFDSEISDLIASALADLGLAGVVNAEDNESPLITTAVKTYCKLHFGEPENPARLQALYAEQKAQMSMAAEFLTGGKK